MKEKTQPSRVRYELSDFELSVMNKAVQGLDRLPPECRYRVLQYLARRFYGAGYTVNSR
jgi:hypothetical protein